MGNLEELERLNAADVTLFDTSPETMSAIAEDALTESFRARLRRFRRGLGSSRWTMRFGEPIPWAAAECERAATVHLGGSLEEIVASEADAFTGRQNDRPFVIVVQPSSV